MTQRWVIDPQDEVQRAELEALFAFYRREHARDLFWRRAWYVAGFIAAIVGLAALAAVLYLAWFISS